MTTEVKIALVVESHEKVLKKWASVGRTFDETDRIIDAFVELFQRCRRSNIREVIIPVTEKEIDDLMEKVAANEVERHQLHAPLEALWMQWRGKVWEEQAQVEAESLVDLSDMPSLADAHRRGILRDAVELANNKHISDTDLMRDIVARTPNMYADDYPELRVESQRGVAVSQTALKLRERDRASRRKG